MRISDEYNLSVCYPKIAAVWDYDTNLDRPEDLTPKSGQKKWFKCSKHGFYERKINEITRGFDRTGVSCPDCAKDQRGEKIKLTKLAKTGSLVLFPKIVANWDYDKNLDRPEDINYKSNEKRYFKCSIHGSYSRTLFDIVKGFKKTGFACPVCSKKWSCNQGKITKLIKSKKIQDIPEMLSLWHPTKNKTEPSTVSCGSHELCFWLCPDCKYGKNEDWVAAPHARGNRGCPACAGKTIWKNSIADLYPVVIDWWDDPETSPYEVYPNSPKKVRIKCTRNPNHGSSLRTVQSLTRNLKDKNFSPCLKCKGINVTLSDSLLVTYPKDAKEWHPDKNEDLLPSQVKAGSAKKVWWRCNNCGYEYRKTIYKKIKTEDPCLECRNHGRTNSKRTVNSNVKTAHPELVEEWYSDDVSPSNCSSGSFQIIKWKCKTCSFIWKASVYARAIQKRKKCPQCISFITTHPHLLEEVSPNNKIYLMGITAGSGKKIWWKCKVCEHEWPTDVAHRALSGRGCPRCAHNFSKQKQAIEFLQSLGKSLSSFEDYELYRIFESIGLAQHSKTKDLINQTIRNKDDRKKLLGLLNDNIVEDDTITHDDILRSPKELLGRLEQLSSALEHFDDEELSCAIVQSTVNKLWSWVYLHEDLSEIKKLKSTNKFQSSVKKQFLKEYQDTKKIKIPRGYSFQHQPSLMQLRFCALWIEKQRFLNLSDTGSGKTISAILGARIAKRKQIIIFCPNSIVDQWKEVILQVFPRSEVQTKTDSPNWQKLVPRYLILNFEKLPSAKLRKIVSETDCIIIDEVQLVKQRKQDNISQRKKVLGKFIADCSKETEDLMVCGLSATPVVNNLYEAKSLLELITGLEYHDIHTSPTIPNCMNLYWSLMLISVRQKFEYNDLKIKEISISAPELADDFLALGKKGFSNTLKVEQIILPYKIPFLLKELKKGDVIYTSYVSGIIKKLSKEIYDAGFSVGHFTGDDKSGLDRFLNGDADVLILSSVGTMGLDGLQHRANRVFFLVLPWTDMEWRQVFGRLRPHLHSCEVYIPEVVTSFGDEEYSWDRDRRFGIIKNKRTIADAVVDGVLPNIIKVSGKELLDQLRQKIDKEIQRIEIEGPHTVSRKQTQYGSIRPTKKRPTPDRYQSTGSLYKYNSSTLRRRFENDPTSFEDYYEKRCRDNIGYQYVLTYLNRFKRVLKVIDLGCGKGELVKLINKTKHKVIGYDLNPNPSTKCFTADICDLPLKDESVDVSVMSLSLCCRNRYESLEEAARIVKSNGRLLIIESVNRLKTMDLKEMLLAAGWEIMSWNSIGDGLIFIVAC